MAQTLIPEFVLNKYHQGLFSGEFQAATLFVDISGFTKLTETFLTHHREGAEALTNALRQIFSPQIEILYERGGFIPFFAGDAFIAIFPFNDKDFGREDAHLQALKTAVAIQDYVSQDGVHRLIETKHGTFGFGVTIGLAFGNIQWGIPGLPNQRTFYFRGNAINGCADAQTKADTGQIVLHDSINVKVADQIKTKRSSEPQFSFLVGDEVPDVPKISYAPSTHEDDLAPFLPDQIRHLQVNEFREVSTIFISFEAPDETELFHQFVVDVTDLLNQFGGYLNQIDVGDKGSLFVILFGAPVAYENNLLRAAGFLQKMHEMNFAVRWRAGMTFGLLWTGIRGGGERGEYGVVGNEINLAARLALKAEWGKILVSDIVYRELKDAYLFYSLGDFQIKGKAQQIPVYLFVYRIDAVDYHDYQGKLIGRESELMQLEKIAQSSFGEKVSRLIYIHGDIGVGKTRLIFEMRRKILYKYFPQSFYCPADEIQQTSLNPFRRFLRNYFGLKPDFSVGDNKEAFNQQFDFLLSQLRDGEEEVSKLINELERTHSVLGAMVGLHWEQSLYEKLDPQLRFENTLDAFNNLIKATAMVRPVILHLEDAQWLDEDSKILLQSLSYGLKECPILIICTCRYLDEGETVQFDLGSEVEPFSIHLDQLSMDNVRQMAGEYLKTAVSVEVAQFLSEKTSGNPFFIEQLLEDLRERNALAFSDEGAVTEIVQNTIKIEDIPASVNTLLLSRLDRLDQQVKNVVRAASVLGTHFQLPVLEAMLGKPEQFNEYVAMAEKQQIWFSQNNMTYQFKHALLRDASYAMQLKSNIREQHRLAGGAIEQIYANDIQEYYGELAFHANKGDQSNLAVKWYHLAGEEAASRYANSEALQHLDRALDLNDAKDLEKEFALRLIRENILGIQGVRDAQKLELDTLSDLAVQRESLKNQTAVSHLRAQYAEATGDYQSVLEHAMATTKLAQECMATTHLVAAHLLQGKAHYRLGEYEQAHYWLKEGLAQAQINDLQSYEAHSLRQIGIVLVDEGQFDEAVPYYEKALEIYDAIGDKSGLGTTYNNLGVVKWLSGDLMDAQRIYNQALSLYKEIGYRRGENMVLMNLGILGAEYGDYEQSKAYYEQVIENLTKINERFGICIAKVNLMEVYLSQFYYELAHETGRQVYLLAEEIGSKRIVGIALHGIGVALRGKQKLVGAEKAFNDAIDLWQKMQQADQEMESRSELALLYLDKKMPHVAHEEVMDIITYLKEHEARQEKINHIIQILFNCFTILDALDDPTASNLLQHAYDMLQKSSGKISELSLRKRFLNDVPIHRKVVEAYTHSKKKN